MSEELKRKLSQRMKITRSARFNYAKRLEGKAYWKSICVNVMSLATLLLGVYTLAYSEGITSSAAKFYGITVIGFSLISIFLSIQEPISELTDKAAKAHTCARQISHVARLLELNRLTVDEASAQYEEIVSGYSDNHDRCDYIKMLREYPEIKDRPSDADGFWGWYYASVSTRISIYSSIVVSAIGFVGVVLLWIALPWVNEYTASFGVPSLN